MKRRKPRYKSPRRLRKESKRGWEWRSCLACRQRLTWDEESRHDCGRRSDDRQFLAELLFDAADEEWWVLHGHSYEDPPEKLWRSLRILPGGWQRLYLPPPSRQRIFQPPETSPSNSPQSSAR